MNNESKDLLIKSIDKLNENMQDILIDEKELKDMNTNVSVKVLYEHLNKN